MNDRRTNSGLCAREAATPALADALATPAAAVPATTPIVVRQAAVPTSRRVAGARRQRGVTLLESVVAFVFVAIATVAASRANIHLRLESDVARDRTQATRLAAADLEDLRAFVAVEAASAARSYAAIASSASAVDAPSVRFRVTRDVDATAFDGATSAVVRVDWDDRSGRTRSASLGSVVAGVDPTFSGALALAHGAGRTGTARGRAAGVPAAARPLGNGRSAWKTNDVDVLVIDDATGHVVATCRSAAAQATIADADLVACASIDRLLVAGTIRFSAAVPPSAAGNDVPPPVDVALALAGSGYAGSPTCATDAMKTVRYAVAGSLRIDAVPIGAAPASLGVASWIDTGERFVAWHCLVPTRVDGRWSGRVDLVATGWAIGTGSGDRRVCRFSADLDGSGTVDAPAEHPAAYAGVAASLVAQDFLVVRGDQACPTDATDVAAMTVAHQP